MNYANTDMFIVAIFHKRPDSALILQALFLICTVNSSTDLDSECQKL